MKSLLRTTLPAVALLAATTLAQAQTQQQDHQVHHPAGQIAQSAPAAEPTPAPGMGAGDDKGMMGMMGMMGGGSMGPGMMGPGMMQQMQGGAGGMPMMPMMMRGGMGMPFEHIEGRIAFLKAEIGVTAEQQKVWDDFAAALRQNAETMRKMHQRMAERMQQEPKPWPDRVEGMANMMSMRAEKLKGIVAVARPLYDALSEEQRSKADSLLAGPMGMM